MRHVPPVRKKRRRRSSTHHSPWRSSARVPPAAKSAIFPHFIAPCIPTLKSRVPIGQRWVHEIKRDGSRIQGHLVAGVPKLFTRQGHDWTHRISFIAEALSRLRAESLVVDGELVMTDGRGDLSAVKAALRSGRGARQMLFYLFDIMHLDGFDLRAVPLLDRKQVLADLLGAQPPPILYSDHREVDGAVMFDHACKLHLEGVVSKLKDAPYWSGRSGAWVEVNCYVREVFTIVGFEPEGKHRIAALHLAKKLLITSVGCCPSRRTRARSRSPMRQ